MNSKLHRSGGKAKLQFILLIAVIVLPIVIANVIHKSGMKTSDTNNYGTLVTPQQQLPEFNLLRGDGEKVALSDLQGIWTIVYIGDGSCDQECQRILIKIKESRLGLSGDALRVQYMYLSTKPMSEQMVHAFAQDHVRMLVVIADKPEHKAVLDTFVTKDVGDISTAKNVYLVDPHGSYMMNYPADFAPNGLVRDLRKLLKYVAY